MVEKDTEFHRIKGLLEVVEALVGYRAILDIIPHCFLDNFSWICTQYGKVSVYGEVCIFPLGLESFSSWSKISSNSFPITEVSEIPR